MLILQSARKHKNLESYVLFIRRHKVSRYYQYLYVTDISNNGFHQYPDQRSTNYLEGITSAFVNKVSLEYNHAFTCTPCLWLLCVKTAEFRHCNRDLLLAKLKISTLAHCLREQLADNSSSLPNTNNLYHSAINS